LVKIASNQKLDLRLVTEWLQTHSHKVMCLAKDLVHLLTTSTSTTEKLESQTYSNLKYNKKFSSLNHFKGGFGLLFFIPR